MNLTVWLYPTRSTDVALNDLKGQVAEMGGKHDGAPPGDRILIFTVPIAAGFARIEAAFNHYLGNDPGSEWLYGNVYADDGVTPLNWWESS